VTSDAADISTKAVSLDSAAAAFAVPAAFGVAQPLPAVPADPTQEGLGHGGLLAGEPVRVSQSQPEGPDPGQDPGSVVPLLCGGHAVQLGQELLAIAPAVLRRQGRAAVRTTRLAHQVGWPTWPVPRDPMRALMTVRPGVAARRAER
jgi:hypothetical protein